jgi:hypothetical protein
MNEAEEIEQLGAMADEVRITRVHPPPASLPVRAESAIGTRAAAAAAAGSFLAGAAVVGLVGRRHRRAAVLSSKRRPRVARRVKVRKSSSPAERLKIVGSRSFVVDVHLLGRPGADH